MKRILIGLATAFALGACGSGAEDDGGDVPQVCLDALDDADKMAAVTATGIDYMADAFYAAADFDVAGIEAANAKLEALQPEIEATVNEYRASRDDCRSEA